jgi:hypothetical protein
MASIDGRRLRLPWDRGGGLIFNFGFWISVEPLLPAEGEIEVEEVEFAARTARVIAAGDRGRETKPRQQDWNLGVVPKKIESTVPEFPEFPFC